VIGLFDGSRIMPMNSAITSADAQGLSAALPESKQERCGELLPGHRHSRVVTMRPRGAAAWTHFRHLAESW